MSALEMWELRGMRAPTRRRRRVRRGLGQDEGGGDALPSLPSFSSDTNLMADTGGGGASSSGSDFTPTPSSGPIDPFGQSLTPPLPEAGTPLTAADYAFLNSPQAPAAQIPGGLPPPAPAQFPGGPTPPPPTAPSPGGGVPGAPSSFVPSSAAVTPQQQAAVQAAARGQVSAPYVPQAQTVPYQQPVSAYQPGAITSAIAMQQMAAAQQRAAAAAQNQGLFSSILGPLGTQPTQASSYVVPVVATLAVGGLLWWLFKS